MHILTDRTALLRNRRRAARAPVTFLHDAARDEIEDRLAMVNRSFTDAALVTGFPGPWHGLLPGIAQIDDTDTLDLAPGAHDLVVHAMALHWADDPVGQLIQCRRALRPDGLFLSVAFGGQTLHELRSALASAEADLTGGLAPRVAPMGDLRDMGALLQRAGFGLPVADAVPLRVTYRDMFHLMHDLRGMGEGNVLNDRLRHPTRRAVLDRAAEIYARTYAEDDRIVATFELIVLTGWAPADSQPQPLRPGSASARLATALGTTEKPLRD